MKTDLFTKVLLTVIAINLTFLTFNKVKIIPKAYAGNNESINKEKNYSQYGMIPLNSDGSVDVNIRSSEVLDINIQQIGGSSTYGELGVKINNQSIKVDSK